MGYKAAKQSGSRMRVKLFVVYCIARYQVVGYFLVILGFVVVLYYQLRMVWDDVEGGVFNDLK
jgi:hypothetical protein